MNSAASASKVKRNFSRSASSYDAAASIQRASAETLARLLAACEPFASREDSAISILELGCGTGLLTTHLLELFPYASIVASDISPAMLQICAVKLPDAVSSGRLRLLEHDFNAPMPEGLGPFDLIASSFALQWGANLSQIAAHAAKCLKPAGQLHFSLPLAGSLEALAETFKNAGVDFPGLSLPRREDMEKSLKGHFANLACELHTLSEGPFALREALQRFRALGAVNTGAAMPSSSLRRVLRHSDGQTLKLDYQVAFWHCGKVC